MVPLLVARMTPGVQQHKLELVLFVELLDGDGAGLTAALGGLVGVARRAGGMQAARNGGKAALRRPLHAAVQFPIIGIEEHHFSRQDHQHGDQQAAPHPPLGNAGLPPLRVPPFLFYVIARF